jgi:hypothetical protein
MSSKPGNYGNRKHSGSGKNPPNRTIMIGTVAETKAPKNKNLSGGKTLKGGKAICPVCELEVNVLKSGGLGSHRVGTSRKQSWPCPGATPCDSNGRW